MPTSQTLPTELDDAACNRALAILVEVGTGLALECQSPGPNPTFAERARSSLAIRAAAYEKVSLAVRRTILLFQHLKSNPIAAEKRRHAPARHQAAVAEREPRPTHDLAVERVEHLDRVDISDDLPDRSPADLIRELSAELGIPDIATCGTQAEPRPSPRPRLPLPSGEGRGEGAATRPTLPH